MQRIENITQAYTQTPWRRQMQYVVLFLLILAFVALVAGIYLNVTARATNVGRDVQDLQFEIEQIERDNASLHAYLANLTAASTMEKRALDLGFEPVQTDQALYILVPGYMERQPAALAPEEQAPLASAPVTPAEYTEPLFSWLDRNMMKVIFPILRNRP